MHLRAVEPEKVKEDWYAAVFVDKDFKANMVSPSLSRSSSAAERYSMP